MNTGNLNPFPGMNSFLPSVILKPAALILLASLLTGCTGDIAFEEPGWGEWDRIDLPEIMDSVYFYSISECPDGNVIVGSLGVVFKQDGSGSWKYFRVYEGRHNVISSIVNDEEGNLFASQDPGGVFVSRDNGESWEQANNLLSNIFVNDLLAAPGGELFAATREGVFVSADKGKNWHPYTSGSVPVEILCLGLDMDNNLVVGTRSGAYITTDNGQSWTEMAGDLAGSPVHDLEESPRGDLYAGSGEGLICRCGAGSGTWNDISPPDAEGGIRAITVSGDGVLYAGENYCGILVSEDGGTTWRRSNLGVYQAPIQSIYSRGDELLACSRSIIRSKDSGYSWTLVQTGMDRYYNTDDWQGILVMEDGSLLAARDRGLYLRRRYSDSWIELWNTDVDSDIAAGSGMVATAGSGGINILDTVSGEVTSSKIADSTGYLKPESVEIDERGRLYAACCNEGVYRSDDRGESWSRLNLTLEEEDCPFGRADVRVNGENALFLFTYEYIFRSMDDGNAWEKISTPGFSPLLSPDGTIYVYNYKRIYASVDNGDSWELRKGDFSYVPCGYQCAEPDFAFGGPGQILFFAAGELFYSRNGGRKWYMYHSLPFHSGSWYIEDLAFGPAGHIYAIFDNGLFRSSETVYGKY